MTPNTSDVTKELLLWSMLKNTICLRNLKLLSQILSCVMRKAKQFINLFQIDDKSYEIHIYFPLVVTYSNAYLCPKYFDPMISCEISIGLAKLSSET